MLPLQESLEICACPTCYAKLVLTKERILFCQNCLLGFRVNGEVPDLRLEQAIHFRKTAARKGQGVSALLTVLTGDKKNQTFEVRLGHCLVICRSPLQDFDSDTTFVGSLKDEGEVENTRIPLDSQTLKHVENSFAPARDNWDMLQNAQPHHVLGGFVRDTDFLVDDPNVSKTHAVIYQGRDGVWLLDLVSSNGTYVNSQEIEHQKLRNNDVVSVGAVSFRVNFI